MRMQNYFLHLILLVLLSSCGHSSTSTPEVENKSPFENLLSKYHKVPAFPFQFSNDDLHSNATELSGEEIKNIFHTADNVIEMNALHYYPFHKEYVLFSMFKEENDSAIHYRVDLFSSKGQIKQTMYTKPYIQTASFQCTPKFELRKDQLNMIYEDLYSDSPDGKTYRSFYSVVYDLTEEGYSLKAPTPFWMYLPRAFFSPLVIDYLRKDGNYYPEISESQQRFVIHDKDNPHIRTEICLLDSADNNMTIGISQIYQSLNQNGLTSEFSIIRVGHQKIRSVAATYLKDRISQIHQLGCGFENLELSENTLCSVLTKSGLKTRTPFVSLTNNEFSFLCFKDSISASNQLLSIPYRKSH